MAKAHEIMVDQVISVSENDSVKTVLRAFVEHRISGVPIINTNNEPAGYISDGDIMKYIGYRDPLVYFFDLTTYTSAWVETESFEDKIQDLKDLNVMAIATKRIITVQFNEEIDEVAKVLGSKKIKKVPVIKEKKLVGIISRGDIVRFVVKNHLD